MCSRDWTGARSLEKNEHSNEVFHCKREYMLSIWPTTDGVNLDHVVKVVSSSFFHYKVTIFPFPYCFWEIRPHSSGRVLDSTSWRVFYTYYLEFFSKEDFSLLIYLFICLFNNYLYQNRLMDIYFILSFNPIVTYLLVAQFVPVLTIGSLSFSTSLL